MTPIAGEVELLLRMARRQEVPSAILAGLERLEASIRHYVRRATTLLNVSRANSGQIPLEPVAFDIAELVCQTVSRFAPAAERARCPLQLDVQPEIAGVWDHLAVEQILDNLLSNALKFGAGRAVSVSLAADESCVTLTVRDEGAGISEQDQARIFGRFEQAVGQRQHGGFGVGLWLVRSLVGAMGGSITVESAPGQGAAFTVRLARDSSPAIGESST